MICQRGMSQGRVQRGVVHSLSETGGRSVSIWGCSEFFYLTKCKPGWKFGLGCDVFRLENCGLKQTM
jgi:hypothetical protein